MAKIPLHHNGNGIHSMFVVKFLQTIIEVTGNSNGFLTVLTRHCIILIKDNLYFYALKLYFYFYSSDFQRTNIIFCKVNSSIKIYQNGILWIIFFLRNILGTEAKNGLLIFLGV